MASAIHFTCLESHGKCLHHPLQKRVRVQVDLLLILIAVAKRLLSTVMVKKHKNTKIQGGNCR